MFVCCLKVTSQTIQRGYFQGLEVTFKVTLANISTLVTLVTLVTLITLVTLVTLYLYIVTFIYYVILHQMTNIGIFPYLFY